MERTLQFETFMRAFLTYCEQERINYNTTRHEIAERMVPTILPLLPATAEMWAYSGVPIDAAIAAISNVWTQV